MVKHLSRELLLAMLISSLLRHRPTCIICHNVDFVVQFYDWAANVYKPHAMVQIVLIT